MTEKYLLNMIKVNQTCTYKHANNREIKYSEMNLSENKKKLFEKLKILNSTRIRRSKIL